MEKVIISFDLSMSHTGVCVYDPITKKTECKELETFNSEKEASEILYTTLHSIIKKYIFNPKPVYILFEDNRFNTGSKFGSPLPHYYTVGLIFLLLSLMTMLKNRLFTFNISVYGIPNRTITNVLKDELGIVSTRKGTELPLELLRLDNKKKYTLNMSKTKKAISKAHFEKINGYWEENDNKTDAWNMIYLFQKNKDLFKEIK